MPVQRADISAELRWPFLVLLILIPVLTIAGVRVYDAIGVAGNYQRAIRTIQSTRTIVLIAQLDEETGIRGFSASGDSAFLEPYFAARATLPATLDELESELAQEGFDNGVALARDEARLNGRWLAKVAEPLRERPIRSAGTLVMQRNGKAYVDAFRQDDKTLHDLLRNAADGADAQTQRALRDLLFLVIGALCLLTLAATVFAFLQARAARRAFENQVLYENQKRIADELQTAFLNKNLPVSAAIRLNAIYIPATSEAQVGGDWYDAFELPDKRILFSIGDVAGHGLEAALVMSRARQAIIAAALHENDPAAVMERANAAILIQGSPMVTAICGYIDPATFEIRYSTAGHPPPILARPGAASVVLPHDGMPLGIDSSAAYRTFAETAAAGAVMVLYTDGVTEFGRDVIEGEERLLDASRGAVRAENPALAIQRAIFGVHAPADDVAILTVTFAALAPAAQGAAAGTARANPERTAVDGRDAASAVTPLPSTAST